MLEKPGAENGDSALGEASLGPPNLAVVMIVILMSHHHRRSLRRRGLVVPAMVELKLLHNGVFKAPEVSGHRLHRQAGVWSGVSEPRHVLERTYHCLHLLVELLVLSVYLT